MTISFIISTIIIFCFFYCIKNKYNFIPLKKTKNDNSGNDKWNGHYSIYMKGGTQDNLIEGNIQLANNISDYCCKKIDDIIYYQMIYYMFHSKNSNNFFKDNINYNEQYIILF